MWMWRPSWLLAGIYFLIGLSWAAGADGQLELPDNTIYPPSNPAYLQIENTDLGGTGAQEAFRRKREYEEDATDLAGDDGQENTRTKRFLSLFRTRATKTEGFKRGPGFRSWGGKRSGDGKRARFNSWGGKRSGDDKRATFNSWGGKRKDSEYQGEKREKEYPMSFEQFQKRTKQELGAKRLPFHTWGGKRDFSAGSFGGPVYFRQGDIRKLLSWEGKRRFSSWGGKRSGEVGDEGDDIEKRKSETERRKPSFHSWAGKRTSPEDSEENLKEENDIAEAKILDY